jgi:hypothetical protein
LDGAALTHENADMMDTGDVDDHRLQMLVLERRDPSRNMARFYVLASCSATWLWCASGAGLAPWAVVASIFMPT